MKIVNILFQSTLAVYGFKRQANPQTNDAFIDFPELLSDTGAVITIPRMPTVPEALLFSDIGPGSLEKCLINKGWTVEECKVDDKEALIKATKKVNGGKEIYSYLKTAKDGIVIKKESYQLISSSSDLNTNN